MARKKKEVIVEPVVENVTVPKEETKIIETPVLRVVTYDEVYLRTKPFLDNNNKNLAGKMTKGKVYDVSSVIDFSVKKMYRLKEGYYVIADEVKIV